MHRFYPGLNAGVAAYVIFRTPRDPRLEKGEFIRRPLMTFDSGTGPSPILLFSAPKGAHALPRDVLADLLAPLLMTAGKTSFMSDLDCAALV